MNRNDVLLVGCGGAGNKITDSIINEDERYMSYFINASKTDIESLDNYDEITQNYFCISPTRNGMGRNRTLGKRFAGKTGWTILDTINKFDQKTIFLFTSFGGGSGSSIVSVLLGAINQLKKEGSFDKVVNLVGVLPNTSSDEDVLKNALDTWNEIMSYDCINSMMFIDNNNLFDGEFLSEDEINENFAKLFDSIFDIPLANGRNFDNGNLEKIINSKGCLHVYNLPSGYDTVGNALRQADRDSVLAKMYESKETVEVDRDGKKRIKCTHIGTSFNDETYSHEEVLEKYKSAREDFKGYNEENNLVLISGCLPPLYSIQVLKTALEDIEKEKAKNNDSDLSKFILDYSNVSEKTAVTNNELKPTTQENPKEKTKNMKNMMKKKKNIFDMYK